MESREVTNNNNNILGLNSQVESREVTMLTNETTINNILGAITQVESREITMLTNETTTNTYSVLSQKWSLGRLES